MYRSVLTSFVDLVFPSRCVVCDRLHPQPLCTSCLLALPYIVPPLCKRCGQPTGIEVDDCPDCRDEGLPHSRCRSLFRYEREGQEVIQALKYRNERRLAPLLAYETLRRLEPELFEVDAVTYVPLHRRKLSERGYNQSELIARALGEVLQLPVERTLLQRRPTADQARLSAEERRSNVRGAYQFVPRTSARGSHRRSSASTRSSDRPHPAHRSQSTQRAPLAAALGGIPASVLLIDDVLTTGATASECAQALREAGVRDVRLLTIARALC